MALTAVFGPAPYSLGCREVLTNGSSPCAGDRCWVFIAGDGLGFLDGMVIANVIALPSPIAFALEYLQGYAFSRTIIQALFMRDMAGAPSCAARPDPRASHL
ncbi:MAG: hypothetical protein ACOH2H_25835 [Cypionkella sp.]